MKKILALLALFAFVSSTALASVQVSQAGTNKGQFKKINLRDGATIDADGNVDFDAVLISGVAGSFTTLASTGDTTLGDAAADVVTVTGTIAGASPLTFEGTTADAFETTLAIADPTADQTLTIPNNAANSAFMTSSLTTNAVDAANSVTGVSGGLLVEGTADTSETTLTFTDPTADRTVTVPDQTGTVYLSGAATALTAGASVTLTVAPGNRLFTDTITTDNQDQTITFSAAGSANDQVRIIFVTDGAGSNDEVITFHSTLCRSVGTLTLANAAASRYVVSFVSDGTKWNEVSRTAVQAA